ncbi:hypothetical protein HDV00_005656 [Rhizophlyctis rosea]|nr:hypothetical protein HDV00_005656 [Rhizophlyctis rosea]
MDSTEAGPSIPKMITEYMEEGSLTDCVRSNFMTEGQIAAVCQKNCIPPSMIAYRLPINELILTRESQDNLADLAGNAMTSTVVGTCMISALILANKLLTPGSASAKSIKRS